MRVKEIINIKDWEYGQQQYETTYSNEIIDVYGESKEEAAEYFDWTNYEWDWNDFKENLADDGDMHFEVSYYDASESEFEAKPFMVKSIWLSDAIEMMEA